MIANHPGQGLAPAGHIEAPAFATRLNQGAAPATTQAPATKPVTQYCNPDATLRSLAKCREQCLAPIIIGNQVVFKRNAVLRLSNQCQCCGFMFLAVAEQCEMVAGSAGTSNQPGQQVIKCFTC